MIQDFILLACGLFSLICTILMVKDRGMKVNKWVAGLTAASLSVISGTMFTLGLIWSPIITLLTAICWSLITLNQLRN